MKKFLLSCALCASMFAAEQFSGKIINLYTSVDAKKAEGKLLPTNAFEIVKDGDLAELKIKGYYNPNQGNILYFNDKNRILVAAFGKKSKLDFKIEKDLKNGFKIASIKVFAKKDELVDLEKSAKPLFEKGKAMFEENCGICHPLHPVSEFNANQWPATFKAMETRTGIDKADRQLVVQYLQKHAKDMK
ncbi:cytochrome C [Campylobacter sp. RM9333]|uniref:cytochrome C n=1 Tax=Campylobacter sp. RM9333 TaxID=2735731 RepID=UPI001D965604|nr:cytochrome C [Campylobacter sp. RM9333]